MKRRDDLDGLRAFAVLPVMLAHAWPSVLTGGHLGVDVFFVLSGYLITSICLNERHAGKFRLSAFWARRIRRILPASLVVLLCVVLFSSVYHLAASQKTVFGTGLSSLLFVSNFYLPIFEGGYFAERTSDNPLSHMWSLSVEEQFYVFFPFLLLLLTGKRFLFVLCLLFVASLWAYCLADASSVWFHYNPLLRFWQILAGGLLAYFLCAGYTIRVPLIVQLLGFAVLLGAYYFASKESHAGGLFVVLGTLILIASGSASRIGKFLSWKVFVWIGLLSYSLYLWHQPVMAFSRLWEPDSTYAFLILTFPLTFLFSAISYFLIEQPFIRAGRGSTAVKRRSVLLVVLAWVLMAGLLFSFGSNIPEVRKKEDTFSLSIGGVAEERSRECMLWGEHDVLPPFCALNGLGEEIEADAHNIDVAFWGDSHMGGLYSGLIGLETGFSSIHLGMSGCHIALDQSLIRTDNDCIEKHQAAVEFIENSESLDVLVVTLNWSNGPLMLKFGEDRIDHIAEILKDLDFDGTVVLTTPIPWMDVSPKRGGIIGAGSAPDMVIPFSSREHLYEAFGIFVEKLDSLGQAYALVDIRDALCEDGMCYGIRDGLPLYYDRSHLNVIGSRLVLDILIPEIEKGLD